MKAATPYPTYLRKMRAARTFGAAGAMMRQLSPGTVDLRLHHAFDTNGDTTMVDYANVFQGFGPRRVCPLITR